MSSISYKICFVLMVLILAIACSNFLCISCSVQKIVEQSNQAICQIDSLMSAQDTLSITDRSNSIDPNVDTIKESVNELNLLKKGIFDSNTITFLASFLLVFLGGILFNIENRARKTISKTQIKLNQIDVEVKQLEFYKQITTLLILTKYMSFQLSASSNEINNGISIVAHEIHNTLKTIQSLLEKSGMTYMTEDAKKENKSVLAGTKLLFDKEEIFTKPENKDKLKPFQEIRKLNNECLKLLEQIKTAQALK